MHNTVYLAIGANLGEARTTLEQAVHRLEAPDLRVLARSRMYRSAPVGPQDQPDFFNAALKAETRLDPRGLLQRLKEIERAMGRTPGRRWGPRVVDLDIILFGQELVNEPDLIIPHLQTAHRAFVLAPLSDLCPEQVVPGLGASVAELLEALPRTEGDLEALQSWT